METSEESKTSSIKIRSGNQMVAEGAINAGCRFFAGYPITPASGIYKTMIDTLPEYGGIAINAPDEISALSYCVGASLRGEKAMTATSGPGWALMVETVQYAIMTETPVVIAVVQRLGPSTGGATQNAQGDLLFIEHSTSGGYTIPLLAPSNPLECYNLTHTAFQWAEILRTPVVVLLDKEVGMTSEDVNYLELKENPGVYRKSFNNRSANQNHLKSYYFEKPDEVPGFIPVGGKVKATVTGSAHNKSGELKKNDPETIEVLYHLQKKIDAYSSKMEIVDQDIEEGAATLILSYGITARTAKESVRIIRGRGGKVSWMNVHSLFPIPEGEIRSTLNGVRRVLIPEENLKGLYRSALAGLLEGIEVVGINKIGSMITPAEIMEAVTG